MQIKAQTIIPANVKITRVAPSVGKGRNIYSLLRAEEKQLANAIELKVKANKFAAALKVGFTVVEALKLINK